MITAERTWLCVSVGFVLCLVIERADDCMTGYLWYRFGWSQ